MLIDRPIFLGTTTADGMTLKAPNGKPVLSYLTRKPEGVPLHGNNVCCFHPLYTPSGECLTDIAPPDHPDHRGVFFAWQSLDFHRKGEVIRGDFWGWGRLAPIEGRVIVNRELRLAASNECQAELFIRNDWTVNGGTMMTERNTARVSEQRGARILDLSYGFESDGDVVINRVAFTGLCVRCRKDGEAWFSNKDGRVELPDSDPLDPAQNWPAADWYAYTIRLNSGQTLSAAVIDHPMNPASTWHEPRPVAFLNPCVSALREVKILAGKPLILRYRVVVMDGPASSEVLNALAAEWRARLR